MNFSDEKYIKGLNQLKERDIVNMHNKFDCFYQLIEGIEPDVLDNLMQRMQLNSNQSLTKEECYNLLQNKAISDSKKEEILRLAYQCLDENIPLGNSLNEFGINKSNWLAHSLQVAKLCSIIAKKCGLDDEKAFRLGILHDYGRKYDHGIKHIMIGFEKLFDLGYYEESIACLTHSFLNVNILAIYAPSNSYVIDENKNAIPVDDSITHNDMYRFLSTYSYSDYDRILNIADLMATEEGIVAPKERILDIEKRRGMKLEQSKREFFLLQLFDTIVWCLNKMNVDIRKTTMDFEKASDTIYEAINEKTLKIIK